MTALTVALERCSAYPHAWIPANREKFSLVNKFEPSIETRLSTAAKAKQSLLEKARRNTAPESPAAAEKRAARRALDDARRARTAERKAAEVAERARKAEAQAAKAAERALALAAERERIQAEIAEKERLEIEAEAVRKAARDARYAARKARRGR